MRRSRRPQRSLTDSRLKAILAAGAALGLSQSTVRDAQVALYSPSSRDRHQARMRLQYRNAARRNK